MLTGGAARLRRKRKGKFTAPIEEAKSTSKSSENNGTGISEERLHASRRKQAQSHAEGVELVLTILRRGGRRKQRASANPDGVRRRIRADGRECGEGRRNDGRYAHAARASEAI
jgi:hypothetical protein